MAFQKSPPRQPKKKTDLTSKTTQRNPSKIRNLGGGRSSGIVVLEMSDSMGKTKQNNKQFQKLCEEKKTGTTKPKRLPPTLQQAQDRSQEYANKTFGWTGGGGRPLSPEKAWGARCPRSSSVKKREQNHATRWPNATLSRNCIGDRWKTMKLQLQDEGGGTQKRPINRNGFPVTG